MLNLANTLSAFNDYVLLSVLALRQVYGCVLHTDRAETHTKNRAHNCIILLACLRDDDARGAPSLFFVQPLVARCRTVLPASSCGCNSQAWSWGCGVFAGYAEDRLQESGRFLSIG